MGWNRTSRTVMSSHSSLDGCYYDKVKCHWTCSLDGNTATTITLVRTGGNCGAHNEIKDEPKPPTTPCTAAGDDPPSDDTPTDGWDPNSFIGQILAMLAEPFETIADSFDQLFNDLSDAIGGILNSIIDTISGLINSAIETITTAASNIFNSLNNIIDETFDTLTGVFNDFTAFINRASEQFIDFVEDTFYEFVSYVGEMVDSALTYFAEIAQSVIETIDEFIQPIIDEIGQLFMTVSGDINTLFDDVSDGIAEGLNGVYEAINVVVADFSEAADTLSDALGDMAGEVFSELGELTNTLDKGVIPELQGLAGTMGASWFMGDAEIGRAAGVAVNEAMPDPTETLERIASGSATIKEVLSDPKVNMSFFGVSLSNIQVAAANILMAIQAASVVNGARVETLIQTMWAADPVKAFSFSEAVGINVRGFISDDLAENESLKSGYDQLHFGAAKLAAETPLNPQEAHAALFREFIDADSYQTYLQRQGFNQEDSKVLRRLADIHPPVQDLITMAVREVFSDDIASKFNLFGDLPSKFVEEAKKGGLTEKWAERYWGAHWRLPSAQQGFEMLHRGFIDADTLDMLIKALDVSPFWREPLKNIAYHPITRVDIRRMLKLGVIDRESAFRRYSDLGYSPEDAELMTQFAESLLDDYELDDELDFRELTRAQVKTLYLQGTFSKDEATAAIEESGYSEEGAWLLVGSWEMALMIKEREELLNMVISKAIREHLSVNDLEKSIFNLQLTADERERISREILLRGKNYTSIPSKTELYKMFEAKIISGKEWFDTMMQHNYSEYWVTNYAKLMGVQIG